MIFKRLIIICALILNSCCSMILSDIATTPPDNHWLSADKIPLFIHNKNITRIKIEIDRVHGLRPHWSSITHLQKLIKEHLPHISEIEVISDSNISLRYYHKHFKETTFQPIELAKQFQTVQLGKNDYLLYLIVTPQFSKDHAGLYNQLDKRRAMITLSRNNIERYAHLYISNKSAEARVLQHEFGHALGLCHNPQHSQLIGGGHCTHPWCNMYKRDFNWRFVLCNLWPAIIGSVEKDYCDNCKSDLKNYSCSLR